ncbi:MAG: inorganic phosphate transporter, partial [Promethearchaeota archaeon]
MDPFIIALLIIAFIVAFAIGTNDETMSPAVGAGVFSVGLAVALGAVINLTGALFLGEGVSKKVGKGLSEDPLSTEMIIAILLSMAIWLVLVSFLGGIPISTTQCVVGAVIGVVWWEAGIDKIDYDKLFEIVIGWVISPIIGFIGAALIYLIIQKARSYQLVQGYANYEKQEQIAGYGLAIFLLWTALSRGGNDVANAVAPLMSDELAGKLEPQVALLAGGIG